MKQQKITKSTLYVLVALPINITTFFLLKKCTKPRVGETVSSLHYKSSSAALHADHRLCRASIIVEVLTQSQVQMQTFIKYSR